MEWGTRSKHISMLVWVRSPKFLLSVLTVSRFQQGWSQALAFQGPAEASIAFWGEVWPHKESALPAWWGSFQTGNLTHSWASCSPLGNSDTKGLWPHLSPLICLPPKTIFHMDPPKISLEQLWISVWQCGQLFQSSPPMADTHSSHSYSRKALFSLNNEKKPNRATNYHLPVRMRGWWLSWISRARAVWQSSITWHQQEFRSDVESPAPRQDKHTHSQKAEAQLQLWAALEGLSALPHLAEIPLLPI